MSQLETILYNNTSYLYKSLGYTLLSDADSDHEFVSSFSDLVGAIAGAIDDASTIPDTARIIKRIYKKEYKNPNYVDTPVVECVDHIMSVLENCSLTTAQMEAKEDLGRELEYCIMEAINDLVIEQETPFNPNPYNIYNECPFDITSREVTRSLIKLDEAVTDEEITEAFMNIGRLTVALEQQYYVTESNTVTKKARELSRKANEKEASVIRKVGGTVSELKKAGKEAVTPMEKFVKDTMMKIKKADENERRNVIIQGGSVPKVVRWLKRSIPLVIGGTIGATCSTVAVITCIAFLGWIATDKYLDKKERAKILRELEDELQIVNEKIDDSRGDENKQKKYELMRIRNELSRTKDKIRLGLKY